MNFSYSEKTKQLIKKVNAFMGEHVYPNESVYEEQLSQQKDRWAEVPPVIEELKAKAKKKVCGIYFYLKVI